MIGGEIEIDPEFSPPQGGRPIREALGLPADRAAFFGTAREAVRWWAENLRPEGPVLVPAYCCQSVVKPYREAGVAYRYYPVDRRLRADPAKVRALATHAGSIQVVHYFGFPASSGLFDLGVPVLEDAVQALLSPDLRKRGAWAIGSLRKFLPVPDGAFLSAGKPFDVPRLPPAIGGAFGLKLFGRMLKHRAVRHADTAKWQEAIQLLLDTEDRLDREPIVLHAMSPRTAEALRGAALEEMARLRRRNYTALYEALEPVFAEPDRGLAPLMGPLPRAVVPYGLPVLSEHRDELKAFLATRGIHAVVHWDLPDDLDPEAFPDSWWIRERELTLPCDHRYGVSEMARIAAAIASFRPS